MSASHVLALRDASVTLTRNYCRFQILALSLVIQPQQRFRVTGAFSGAFSKPGEKCGLRPEAVIGQGI